MVRKLTQPSLARGDSAVTNRPGPSNCKQGRQVRPMLLHVVAFALYIGSPCRPLSTLAGGELDSMRR